MLFIGIIDNIREDHYAVGTVLQVGSDAVVEVIRRHQNSSDMSLPDFQHPRERVSRWRDMKGRLRLFSPPQELARVQQNVLPLHLANRLSISLELTVPNEVASLVRFVEFRFDQPYHSMLVGRQQIGRAVAPAAASVVQIQFMAPHERL